MTDLRRARTELATLAGEVRRLRREQSRTSELWTADKLRWQARNQELQQRVRLLERLLVADLTGKSNGSAAHPLPSLAALPGGDGR